MKTATRWICGLLALLMILSLLPLTAMAASSAKVRLVYLCDKKELRTETIEVSDEDVDLEPDKYIEVKNKVYALKGFSNGKKTLTIPAYDGSSQWKEKWGTINVEYEPHTHEYTYTYNRMTHDIKCKCGKVNKQESHIDPSAVSEKACICGYKFGSNTDLTTIWLTNIRLDQPLEQGRTEYTGSTVTYYDVKDTFITIATMDGKARVELPTDRTLQEGLNTFEVRVTAEDKSTVTTYTFKIIKPIVVERIPVLYDGETVTIKPQTVSRYPANVAKISDAVKEKALELLAQEGYTKFVVAPVHSLWGNLTVSAPITADVVAKLVEAEQDLVVDSLFGTVTIPAAQLAELASETEDLTVSITKNTDAKIFVGETEITEIPEEILVEMKEA